MRLRSLELILSLILAVPFAAGAQLRPVADDAQFTILRAGMTVGTESVRLTRQASDQGVRLETVIRHRESQRMVDVTIYSDTLGSPLEYRASSRDNGSGGLDTLRGSRMGSRFVVRSWSGAGDAASESCCSRQDWCSSRKSRTLRFSSLPFAARAT
jgi:hypothetical protein